MIQLARHGNTRNVLEANCFVPGKEPFTCKLCGHEEEVYAWDTLDNIVVTGGEDKTVRVWVLRSLKMRNLRTSRAGHTNEEEQAGTDLALRLEKMDERLVLCNSLQLFSFGLIRTNHNGAHIQQQ